LIVSDGATVWFYQPDNRQVVVSQLTEAVGSGSVALNYLTGIGRVTKDFRTSFIGEGRDRKGNYLLELTPRQEGQMLAKLQLTVAAEAVEQFQKNGQVEGLFPVVASVVHDQLGNRTTIEFSKPRVNRGIGDGRFSFKAPDGVEVVRIGQ
jgi:outer membrane lipoprotein carrier protein